MQRASEDFVCAHLRPCVESALCIMLTRPNLSYAAATARLRTSLASDGSQVTVGEQAQYDNSSLPVRRPSEPWHVNLVDITETV